MSVLVPLPTNILVTVLMEGWSLVDVAVKIHIVRISSFARKLFSLRRKLELSYFSIICCVILRF